MTVMIWVVGLVETSQHRSRVYEHIVIRPDGEPVIQSYTAGDFQNFSYRTLAGDPTSLEPGGQLSSASLDPMQQPPPLFDWPLGWGQSLGASDSATPRGAWYLIRNGEADGKGYFIGYDALSRLPIGYLSRSGFRQSLPPTDDWFKFGRRSFGYGSGGIAASVQRLSYNNMANLYDYGTDRETLRPWMVYVIVGDDILEVNLRARTVRRVIELTGIISLGLLTEAIENKDRQPESKWQFVHRLGARSNDRLIVLDPDDGTNREFKFPETLSNERFDIYSLSGEQLLLQWYPKSDDLQRTGTRLTWIANNGSIQREESVQLGGAGESISPQAISVAFALGAPVPLAWATFAAGIGPIGMYQSHDVASYSLGVEKVASMAWPGIVLVVVLGCVSAVLVWRWQRRYCRGGTGAWCAFAFLLGLTGLAAYWLEHRRAKLEACGECAANVPRDRDACALCNAPFAAPPLVGTEIFA
jgi:hypothetical protein